MYINRKKYQQESQRSQYQSWVLRHQKETEENELSFFIKQMYVRFTLKIKLSDQKYS